LLGEPNKELCKALFLAWGLTTLGVAPCVTLLPRPLGRLWIRDCKPREGDSGWTQIEFTPMSCNDHTCSQKRLARRARETDSFINVGPKESRYEG
jgi:hypothetical protein